MAKPPYTIPTMKEIDAVPRLGLRVASTFCGAGGSCLGYRMAGCEVVYANDIDAVALASYKANAPAGCVIDHRDIRQVKPKDIGTVDILDGSPPCQPFSAANVRKRSWGDGRNDTLFHEYVRLLRAVRPKAFVVENVKGLVTGMRKGMFLEVLALLKQSGYRVKCKLIDAQYLGVPQRRARTVFVGIRNDLKTDPVFPEPFGYVYTLKDAVPWIAAVRSDETPFGSADIQLDKPSYTVTASIQNPWRRYQIMDASAPGVWRSFDIREIKRICSFPDDYVLTGSFTDQWRVLGNSVPPVMMRHVAAVLARVLKSR